MADFTPAYPTCQATRPVDTDDGTMCRAASASPGPVQSDVFAEAALRVIRTDEVNAVSDSVVGNIAQLSYDAFIRKHVYEPAARAISKQGEEFVRIGAMTNAKAAEWVNAERNALLVAIRDEKNSPLGRAISEYLKSRDKLPSVGDLAAKYGAKMPGATEEEVFAAIIKSGARTRGSVNRLAVGLRWAGPVMIGISIAYSAYLVAEAPPEERGRLASREAGGLVGGIGGGWAGAKGGCAAGAAVGVWFEGVGAVPGCVIGAVVFGLGIGYVGSEVGSWAGGKAYDFTNAVLEWEPAKH